MHALDPVQRIENPYWPNRSCCTTTSEPREAQRGRRSSSNRWACPPVATRSYPHQLSGGQKQQRVMIAMALACRPKLLIADEPTTALDVMVQAQVLDPAFPRWSPDLGLGVVFISHDLSVLASTCDRVAGHVRGPNRRTGQGERRFHQTAAPLRPCPRGGVSLVDARFRYAPAGVPGDPPVPRRPAGGLSVPPALLRPTE